MINATASKHAKRMMRNGRWIHGQAIPSLVLLGNADARFESSISIPANAVLSACSDMFVHAAYFVERVSGEARRDQKTAVTSTGKVVMVLKRRRCRNWRGRGQC